MMELETYLSQFRRRIRLQDTLAMLQTTLWIPAALAIAIQIIGRLIPVPDLAVWTVIPFPVWLIVVAGLGWLAPKSLMTAARNVDQALGLKERLSTALAFTNIDPKLTSSNLLSGLIIRQREDALRAAAAVHPEQDLPIPWHWKPAVVGLTLLVISLLLTQIRNPMTLLLQERAAIKEQAQAQAEKIEAFKESVEESAQLTDEEKQELIKKLEQLAEALRNNPGDLEQAIADLSRFEEALRRDVDPSLGSTETLLHSFANRLSELAGSQDESGKQDSASEALQALSEKLDDMSPAEREQLARNLAQMAASSFQLGNNSLGQSLSDLAQAIQAGDKDAAQQAAIASQASMKELEKQISSQQAIQAALAQAQASRQALSQTAKSTSPNSGQAGAQNPGAAPGSGAQPGAGGGSFANQLPPARGGRTNVRPQGNAADAPLGSLDNQVYSPWERPGTSENELFIPGQELQEGETTSIEGQSPQAGIANPSLVPYNQVFFQYLSAANQAMQKDFIPGDLRDFVRDYFASLEPGN